MVTGNLVNVATQAGSHLKDSSNCFPLLCFVFHVHVRRALCPSAKDMLVTSA